MENHSTVLQDVLLLLAAAVVAVALFRRLRLPPLLAYLAVGMLVGPYGAGWLADDSDTRLMAELGVVFLLFTVGLEFSLAQLIAMRREVLGLGGAQVVITTAAAALAAWLAGLPGPTAVVVGGALAMSSTAVVVKQLTEQAELATAHGRTSVGILLFQDMAVLPFLVAVPVLAAGEPREIPLDLLSALGRTVAVVLVLLAAGRWLLRPLFREIAAARSSELFTLAALLTALTAAWASAAAGLSLSLGAFLAGMLLGETEFRHQVEADIRPFRDVLLGLFFVTVGMSVDPAQLPALAPWALLLLAALLLFKFASITALALLGGARFDVAARTGVILAEGGEFGFAILSLALGTGLLLPQHSQLLLLVLLFSMAATPFLVRYNGAIAGALFSRLYRRGHGEAVAQVRGGAEELSGHVIICGFGRAGQGVARFVEHEGLEYIALDLDPERVDQACAAGERVVFGDATQLELLNAAGLARARVLVVTFADEAGAERLLAQVRPHAPELPILVRTRDDSELERLQRAGATEVVPETLEASLMLVSHLMLLLDVPVERVVRQVQRVRGSRYRMLRGFFLGQEASPLEEPPTQRERLYSVTLPDQAYAAGRRLGELALERAGVVVTAVRRGGIRGEQPQADMRLRAGDTVVLYGSGEDLQRAERVLLGG